MTNLNIPIDDELRRRLEAEAARAGFQSLIDYVQTLLQRTRNGVDGPGAAPPNEPRQGSSDLWKTIDELAAGIPNRELAAIPKDFAENIDRYLYGESSDDEAHR